MAAVLESRFPFACPQALNGARVPRLERDVKVLLDGKFTVAVQQEISDEDA